MFACHSLSLAVYHSVSPCLLLLFFLLLSTPTLLIHKQSLSTFRGRIIKRNTNAILLRSALCDERSVGLRYFLPELSCIAAAAQSSPSLPWRAVYGQRASALDGLTSHRHGVICLLSARELRAQEQAGDWYNPAVTLLATSNTVTVTFIIFAIGTILIVIIIIIIIVFTVITIKITISIIIIIIVFALSFLSSSSSSSLSSSLSSSPSFHYHHRHHHHHQQHATPACRVSCTAAGEFPFQMRQKVQTWHHPILALFPRLLSKARNGRGA